MSSGRIGTSTQIHAIPRSQRRENWRRTRKRQWLAYNGWKMTPEAALASYLRRKVEAEADKIRREMVERQQHFTDILNGRHKESLIRSQNG